MANPDANGWYEIETAPKDGCTFLSFDPQHGYLFARWTYSDDWPPSELEEGEEWEELVLWSTDGTEHVAGGTANPTHWQPLPEPPVERSKSKGQEP